MRQASNRLCTLMGIPATDISNVFGAGPIPTAPPTVAIGIPADLVRRRPDVRQAERLAAAQAEQIGIAQSALYPMISINGVINWESPQFRNLFNSNALNGSVGPNFQWNLLNYGRIENNVLLQDATFKQLVIDYQQTALQASQEVENGIVTFLRSQVEERLLRESVQAANSAVAIVVLQYEKGAVDFNRFATIEQSLVTEQDSWAQSQGQIAQGLVQIYRALGGGWEMRCQPNPNQNPPPAAQPNPAEAPKGQPALPPGVPVRLPEAIPAPPTAPAEPVVPPGAPVPPGA